MWKFNIFSLNIKILKKFLFQMTCGSNSEMNRCVNVGIGSNTSGGSLQEHLCDSHNSRDVCNDNTRESLMRVEIYMTEESKLNINVGAGHIDPCLGCEACWCEARTCYFLRNWTIGSSRTGSPFVPNKQRTLSDVQ